MAEETKNTTEAQAVSESRTEIIHMVRPNHLNGAGRLFGGALMQWLDEAAGTVAMRHRGAYNGEIIVIIGKVTYVGRTSMEVRLDTYVEHLENGMRQPINRAYFTMVAMDENDQPRTVPRLILETESDRADWEAAEKRREMRMRRKEEGF